MTLEACLRKNKQWTRWGYVDIPTFFVQPRLPTRSDNVDTGFPLRGVPVLTPSRSCFAGVLVVGEDPLSLPAMAGIEAREPRPRKGGRARIFQI